MEQLRDLGPGRLFLDRQFEGPTKLPEDLELPGHDRLETRGDTEEMGRDVAVEVHREVVREGVRGQIGGLGERVGDLLNRPVEPVDDRDDLGAQARRDEDRLVHVALAHQGSKDLTPLVFGDTGPFEEVQGGVLVVDAHRDQRHDATPLLTVPREAASAW